MVQAAWVEKGGVKWAVAVLTDENPTKSYGWDTQKGFPGLLLGREPTAGVPRAGAGVGGAAARQLRRARSLRVVDLLDGEVAVALGPAPEHIAPTRASSSASASGET